MNVDLSRLRQLTREITDGPWTVAKFDDDPTCAVRDIEAPAVRTAQGKAWPVVCSRVPVIDAEFIVTGRNAMPDLLNMIEVADDLIRVLNERLSDPSPMDERVLATAAAYCRIRKQYQ